MAMLSLCPFNLLLILTWIYVCLFAMSWMCNRTSVYERISFIFVFVSNEYFNFIAECKRVWAVVVVVAAAVDFNRSPLYSFFTFLLQCILTIEVRQFIDILSLCVRIEVSSFFNSLNRCCYVCFFFNIFALNFSHSCITYFALRRWYAHKNLHTKKRNISASDVFVFVCGCMWVFSYVFCTYVLTLFFGVNLTQN